MNSIPIFISTVNTATAGSGSHSTSELVIIGFLFVMVVLSLLCAVTSTIGVFFAQKAARDAARAADALKDLVLKNNIDSGTGTQPAQASGATDESDTNQSTAEEDDPVILAVITAAVHSAIGDRAHRIISVHPNRPAWAQEGRRQIFSSHRVR